MTTLSAAPARPTAPAATLRSTLADSATMFRRSLRHLRRYPSLTLMLIGLPVVLLLVFVLVLGGTLGAGLGGAAAAGGSYVDYITPGILLMAVASAAQGTAISVATDMTTGIIDRFRTMPIARSSVLTGHVLGAMVQTVLCLVVVLVVAVALGFRPHAGVVGWLAATGVLLLFTFALTWACTALGLAAKSVETASNSPMIFTLLPFLGSGFVPTDSMPAGVRWFAEYQPFTPVIETLRGLLFGSPIGANGIIAVAWCLGITVVSYVAARRRFSGVASR